MFKDNKYTRWYFSIIEKARKENRIKTKEVYYENHHIIPRALGGSNEKDNLQLLTPREHFICHWLLIKMIDGESKMKMCFALHSLKRKNRYHKRNISSWQYELCKSSISDYKHRSINVGKITVIDVEGNIFHTTNDNAKWISGEYVSVNKGLKRNWTETEIIEKYKTRRGRKFKKGNSSNKPAWNKGKQTGHLSVRHKQKIAESNKNKPKIKVECPICKMIGGIGAMYRWHFSNCKGI